MKREGERCDHGIWVVGFGMTGSKPPAATMWFALLRGINVGGKCVVPMAQLREVFAGLGHQDVETHLNSGNVIFRSATPGAKAAVLAQECEQAIEKRFKRPVRVILRTEKEMRAVAAKERFAGGWGADPSRVVVFFCDGKAKGKLDAGRSPGDAFVVDGREVYLSCPEGVSKSKFTIDYLERTLGVVGTGRNWRTVTRLAGWGEK
jgi:uncharacterized protein (DUF1697 family)